MPGWQMSIFEENFPDLEKGYPTQKEQPKYYLARIKFFLAQTHL